MMKRLKANRNQKGQAAIEFIVTAVVTFFFLFLLLSVALLLVVSDYVEFATFMAARTYKSGFSNKARQESNATLVFNKYFEAVQGIARNKRLRFFNTDPSDEHTGGLTATYDIDLFYLPPLFLGTDPQGQRASAVTLSSEVHLGRDPSFEDCQSFFQDFATNNGITNSAYTEMMEDNGC